MKKVVACSTAALALLLGGGSQASEIRVGFTLDALTMDPANHRNRETETILRNLYDGLVTRDAQMKVVPEIAESWTAIDPTTYEFKLRDGVKFHSGDALTAEDIKFTFDRLIQEGAMDGQSSPRAGLLGPLKSIEVVDPKTVRFHLESPWPILLAMLPFQEVVSKKFVEEVGSQGMAGQVNGTGPFRLKEWRKGDAIIMEKFDDYYGGSSEIPPVGPACVDRAVFKVIPESASRVAALLSGDVDIINELPPHAISQVTQSPNAEVVTVNGTRSFFISLNNQKPPFDDVRVRQAANYALNKKLIIDRILNGKATPISGILSPDAFSHDPDLPTYDYDLEKARQLLAEAGYPDGLDVTLDVEGGFKDIAEAVGSVLTKAGIRTRLVVGEGTMLKQEWLSADQAREGDMWFTSWGNGSLDPVDIFDPVLATGARGNSAGYSNPELDSLLSQAGTLMDADKRTELYHQAQAIVNRDAPLIFLWVPQDIYGVSKRLSGWQPSADSRINLHDACVD